MTQQVLEVEDAGWQGEVLHMIVEDLNRYQCCHGEVEAHKTAPMFLPELIACIIKRAKLDALQVERDKYRVVL